MLVIIDMQNHILDHKNGSYVAKAKTIIPKIAERLNSARQNGEYVLFTKDVPIRYKGTLTEENDSFQIISQLQPLAHEKVLQKYYYTLSPEILLDLKRTLFKSKKEQKTIEIVGVETNLCVFSNTLALQGAFPEADFIINCELVASSDQDEEALKLLKRFNIDVKEK
ncbi:MAG TPA: cysteine hydrolase [Candidatus Tetragenococcus pullicola]|nr:cysteine hydrolase [Candidatus Tetragenococcus pullicola]